MAKPSFLKDGITSLAEVSGGIKFARVMVSFYGNIPSTRFFSELIKIALQIGHFNR